MKIQINFELLVKHNLTPSGYCFLWMIYHNDYSYIEYVGDCSASHLESEQWIFLDEIPKRAWKLRGKALSLFEYSDLDKMSIEEFSLHYRNLWPSGISSGGYPVKGDKQGCIKKMTKFLKDHKEYSRKDIIDATKTYLDIKRKEGWKFTNLAHYFIDKDGISNLSACIEQYKSKEYKPKTENIERI